MKLEKPDMDERQEKLFQTSIFLGKLLLAGFLFQAVLWIYPDTTGLQSFFASIVSAALKPLGFETTHQGTYVLTRDASYVITQDCLGWKSVAAFLGLMFASPGRTSDHLKFISAGVAGLLFANLVRVASTIALSEAGILSFDVIHGVLWRWGLTAVVLVTWLYWFENFNRK